MTPICGLTSQCPIPFQPFHIRPDQRPSAPPDQKAGGRSFQSKPRCIRRRIPSDSSALSASSRHLPRNGPSPISRTSSPPRKPPSRPQCHSHKEAPRGLPTCTVQPWICGVRTLRHSSPRMLVCGFMLPGGLGCFLRVKLEPASSRPAKARKAPRQASRAFRPFAVQAQPARRP